MIINRIAVWFLFLVVGLAGAVPAPAFAVSKKAVFYEVTPLPTGALTSIREYASKNEIYYKFPFSYKNALLVVESPSELSSASLCFLDSHSSNALTIQLELTGKELIFAAPASDFKHAEFVNDFLRKIFPDAAMSIKEKPSDEPSPLCNEMRMIQWPNIKF